MLSILKSEHAHMQQPEINSMIIYICKQILNPAEAAANQLCVAQQGVVKVISSFNRRAKAEDKKEFNTEGTEKKRRTRRLCACRARSA